MHDKSPNAIFLLHALIIFLVEDVDCMFCIFSINVAFIKLVGFNQGGTSKMSLQLTYVYAGCKQPIEIELESKGKTRFVRD